MGRRFLLMHVTTSSGHHHASRAIGQALRLLDPHSQVVSVDAFDYTSRFIRVAIMRSYLSMIRYQPDVWGYLYDNPAIHKRVRHLRGLLHRYHARKLQRLLETVQPHAIACTQAFPCGMVADFKKHRGLPVPIVGVLTDYSPHLYWLHDAVDVYVVPAEEVKRSFQSHGVQASRLRVYGIPIDPRFLEPVERRLACRAFGLDETTPVILVMGGGGGFGPLRELMLSLDRVPLACQIVVLAGTNQALLSWFRAQRFRHRVLVNGYVNSVAQLMEIATLLITKPGGLTTAEALAKHLPMLIITPIPGQELCNARYLLSQGAAVPLQAPEAVHDVVTQLLREPARVEELRRRAASVANPDSALQTARLLIELSGIN
jgi:processive 1,2-diacylglycerol beta-glucosyltransferase